MKWIQSTGGPLILMEESLASKWKGMDGSSIQGHASDYERACEVTDYANLILINGGKAIVFGDEPDRLALFSNSDSGALLVRWKWAPNEETVIRHLENLKESDMKKVEDSFQHQIVDYHIKIFDAVNSGGGIDDQIEMHLVPGNYIVNTYMYKPENETCLLLHRLSLN